MFQFFEQFKKRGLAAIDSPVMVSPALASSKGMVDGEHHLFVLVAIGSHQP